MTGVHAHHGAASSAHIGRQLGSGPTLLGTAIRTVYPDAFAAARRQQAVLELRLGMPRTDEEMTYLTIHVARMLDDERA